MMAIGAVKSGVAMYKEAKSVGKEAIGVITEISEGLGSFFEHQEKAIEYAKEAEKTPPKGKSLQAIALDNVLRRKKLEQAEADLRTMLTWEAPPELGALWTDFQAERAKLMADKDKFDKAQKKRMSSNHTKGVCDTIKSRLASQSVLQYLSWRSPLAA